LCVSTKGSDTREFSAQDALFCTESLNNACKNGNLNIIAERLLQHPVVEKSCLPWSNGLKPKDFSCSDKDKND